MARPSRDDTFMAIAMLMAQRGTCTRAKVGAVITQNGRIVSTGYVGSPSKQPHCVDEGCIIGPEGGCIRTVHAESAAIAFAAREGVALDGATIYVTHNPCINCAKLIINAGIKRVVWLYPYRQQGAAELLRKSGVELFPDGGFYPDWWFMEEGTLVGKLEDALEETEEEGVR